MLRLLTLPAALILSALRKIPLPFASYLCLIFVKGMMKGYAQDSIRFLIAQACLETAYGTSNSFKSRKNGFGMGCPRVRETTSTGCDTLADGGGGQAIFDSYQDSVTDRFLWDEYFDINIKNGETYGSEVLSAGYHASSSYSATVDSISRAYFNNTRIALGVTIPLEVTALGYLIYSTVKSKT